jgi:predicted glycoside hydrolase/deacetylase ChbG (UPF0249 family)
MTRQLIVNADDFGLSEGVNRGIIEASEHGILTSASLMVRQPAAAAAAAYARTHSRISVGLHLDLGEWVYRDGEWVPLYFVVATEDARAVAKEVARQLEEFERLVGRPPSHLDSHQHVHRQEPALSIVRDHAHRLGVPVREQTPGIAYCGDFYGQTGEGESLPDVLSVAVLKQILATLPEGVTELGCHPGYDDGLATAYRAERALETKVLCAPEIRDAIKALGVELRSFNDFKISGSRPWAMP